MLNQSNEVKSNFTVKVTRCQAIKEGAYVLDITVNDVNIYGIWYREGVKDGKEYSFFSFPSYKGKDGRYHRIAAFPITKDIEASMMDQMKSLLGGA